MCRVRHVWTDYTRKRAIVRVLSVACIFPLAIQHALDVYKSLLDHGASYVCICLETLITNISVYRYIRIAVVAMQGKYLSH